MNCKYLVVAALLIGTASPLFAQSVTAGIDAWQRADYAGAVAIWRPLAEKGDADAEFNLGQAYRLGRGVQTNVATAKTWFERAADQGHLDAQTTLGLLLFDSGDQPSGLKWLKKAADQGEPRALLVYGTALVNGDSVPQDPVLGYAYVSRAAAQGLVAAKQTLGQLDELLPIADRRRGGAIARDLVKGAPVPAPTPACTSVTPLVKEIEVAAAKPPSKPAAKPHSEPAAKPPSEPAAKPPSEPAAKPPSEPAAKPHAKEIAPVKSAEIAPRNTPAPVASGNWRIQLGAFSQRGNAEALYKKLSGKSALAGRQPIYVAYGTITRLQLGPFETKSTAASACKSLGVACFVVPAK